MTPRPRAGGETKVDPKKRKRRLQEFGVGLVVVAGLVLLAMAILAIGRENRLFVSRVSYQTVVRDASGLRVGSPVTMAGVRIGSVDRIILPTSPTADGIRLHVSIDRSFAPRVRAGTRAGLAILQIVAGEKVVTLTPGDPAQPALPPNAVIPGAPPSPLMEAGRNIAETAEEITDHARAILYDVRHGKGLVGRAITDPASGEAIDRLTQALVSTSAMLERANRGEGLAGKLLADRAYADRVSADLAKTSAALAEVSARLASGQGLLGSMTTPGKGDDVVGSLAATAESLRRISASVERGDGLAGMLVTDRERSERIAANLDETAANLATITRKVNDGQGTLGLLVNDRGLHDNANQLVAGARQSRVLSWIIRRFQRRGAELGGPPAATPDGSDTTGTGAAPGSPEPAVAPAPQGTPDGRERPRTPATGRPRGQESGS